MRYDESKAVVVCHTGGHSHFAWASDETSARKIIAKRSQPAVVRKYGAVSLGFVVMDSSIIKDPGDWNRLTGWEPQCHILVNGNLPLACR